MSRLGGLQLPADHSSHVSAASYLFGDCHRVQLSIEYLESIGVPCCCQAALLDDLVKQGQGRLTEITREQYRGKPKNPCQSAAVAYGEAMTTEMLHKVSS